MAIKLFPNLERLSIKEHAKSKNYEDYIGVVLDKKNNNFKVVEGQFTDKKDMYRKMKARGLILRKAYERKVWEWIEANADGVIISYLMLSTAFSKWRSNNVLHKYYEKLLNDIPELNREREKGNPNTRGGDFITTDDKDAPKRKNESVDLEEADNKSVVKLVGVTDTSKEEIPYTKEIKLPEINIKHPSVLNLQLLEYIKAMLSGENSEFDKVIVKLSNESNEDGITINYDSPKVEKDIEKYNNMTKLNQLKDPISYNIELVGINQREEPVISRFTSDNGSFEISSELLYDDDGKFIKNSPVIVDMLDDIFRTNNSEKTTGVKQDFNSIKVFVDGNLFGEYSKNKAKVLKTNNDVYGKGERTIASNVTSQLRPRIDEIKTKLDDPNISEEEKISLKKELNRLKSQLSFAANDTKNDVNRLKGSWQTKASYDLRNDSQEARDALKGNNELIALLSRLSKNQEDLETYNNFIINAVYDGKFKNKNTSYNLMNSFTPFTTEALETISKSIQKGEPVAEEEKERKEKLHNLIWYLLADATFDKMYNKDYNEYIDGTTDVNAISDLMQYKNSIGTGGFNHKTQSGKRNADIQIGDQLPKIAKELKKLGVTIPTKEPTKLFTPEVLSNVRNIKNLDKPFSQPERVEQIKAEYPLPDDVKTEIVSFVNNEYNNKIKNRIKDEEDRGISRMISPEVSKYVSKLKSENPDIGQNELDDEVNKFKKDTFDEYKKKYEKEIDANNELKKERYTNEYSNDIDNEIYNLSAKVYEELQKKPKDKSEKEYTKAVLDDLLNTQKESVNDAFQSVNSGANALSNSIPYQGQGFGYSAGPIKMTGQIVEDTTKSELNPKLFKADVLIPEVRDGLYKIATAFKDYLDLPFEIKDIYLTGSNANYNYTDDSDIDLHLVYDFEQAGVNAELLSKYLVAAKKDFNDKYDIKVKGIPVELGCENVNEPLVSTGVYSLGANAWVIKPTNSGIQIPDVDMNAFNDISNKIDDIIKNQNASAISNLWKSIRDIRKNSLSNDGEFGMGNILFKKLRNDHYLDKLRDKMYDAQSKELSLESSERLREDSELNDKKDYSEYLKDLQKELASCDTQDLLTNKSLISYLDGYRDKNEVRETKESNGVLNEADVPNWKLNRALKYMEKDIPAEISQYTFVDLDGLHLCRLKYDSKKDVLYKIPVERQEVANGAYHFVSNPDLKQEISLEDFNKILYSDINQKVLHKTSLYDDMEQTATEVEKYKNDKRAAFNNWYNKNKDFLELDNLLQNNKRLRNSVLMQMYRDNTSGSVYLTNLLKKYKKYYDMSNDQKTEVDEALEKRLNIKNDRNIIEKIFTAIGLDPRYITRPIYEEFEKYNPKTHNYDKVERQWQIVGVDDVRKFLNDDKFDIEKAGGYSHINVWIKDVNADENGLDGKPIGINLVELSRKLDNNALNSMDNDDSKIAYDIHTKQSNPSTKFVSQTRQTYTQNMLSPDQVRKALEFVQSKDYMNKIKSDVNDLEKKLSKLNPEKETDKELIYLYKKELGSKQKVLDFKYVGDGNLVNLYDNLKSMNQAGFSTILAALNAVEEGVKITPRYSVMDPHGFTFYIKLPTKGFTYEDIKNHGSYDTQDMINTVKKYNRSH